MAGRDPIDLIREQPERVDSMDSLHQADVLNVMRKSNDVSLWEGILRS